MSAPFSPTLGLQSNLSVIEELRADFFMESKPTRPGDTLRVETEIVEIVPSRSKPNQGSVKVRSTTLNQDGEAVLVFTAKILAFKSASI
jgi:acyl dehydratase